MQSIYPADNLPSSPWATRYPARLGTSVWENTNHSILAPAFPRIDDPKYYDQVPDKQTPQTAADHDRLFFAERTQNDDHYGLQTWQAATLNRYVRLSSDTIISGGHRPIDRATAGLLFRLPPFISPQVLLPGLQLGTRLLRTNEEIDLETYLRHRIVVDETRWLPFLRKDRWFNMTEGNPRDPGRDRAWSVDEPKLWEILRVSLELVHRFTEALIEERHEGDYWSNLKDIFGEPPEPNDSVLLSYPTEQRISEQRGTPCEWDDIPNIPSSAWRDRLIKLLGRVIWIFQKSMNVEGATHFTVVYQNASIAPYSAIIATGVDRIEPMLDHHMTVAEICMAQVDIALTMMHEMMHAIIMVRYDDDDYDGNLLDKQRSGPSLMEPFLNGTGIAEAGHYMDQQFFGGTKNLFPVPRGISQPPFAMEMREFPWSGYPGHVAPRSAFMAEGHMDRVHHLPVTWVSKLLTESFWNDPTHPRKSENFFHRNPIVFSDIPNYTVRAGPAQAHEPPRGPYSYPDDAVLLESWKERERLWHGLREGWYAEARAEWEDSPWIDVYGRRSVERFALAFQKKDIIACAKLAHEFCQLEWWHQDDVAFDLFLPSPVARRPSWAFCAIGLLMMASIPLVRSEIKRPVNNEFWLQLLTPSETASAGGDDRPLYLPLYFETNEYLPESVRASRLYRRPLQGMSQQDINQFYCLRLVELLIINIAEKGGLVHKKMITAILNARQAIHDDRAAFGQNATGPEFSTLWTTRWFFEFPEYDQALRQWDGEHWSEVPRTN